MPKNAASPQAYRRQLIRKLERRIVSLQNEADFIEILVQFWPWQNMAERMEVKQESIRQLQKKVRYLQTSPQSHKAKPLPFQRHIIPTSWSAMNTVAALHNVRKAAKA